MMQMPNDFPPVPKCFSHLLNGHGLINYDSESDDHILSRSLPVTRFSSELNSAYFRSLSDNDYRTALQSQNNESTSTVTVTDSSINLNSVNNNVKDGSPVFNLNHGDVFTDDDQTLALIPNLSPSPTMILPFKSGVLNTPQGISYSHKYALRRQQAFSAEEPIETMSLSQDLNNPYVKLNSSLEKLQKEMKELRLFDVRLFYQLLNLHDAIQDMKMNNDRFSETASECSLGSASYMGSMSSLDEESDWGESQMFMSSFRGEDSTAEDEENRQSTSTLLEQINALTQKAEEDYI